MSSTRVGAADGGWSGRYFGILTSSRWASSAGGSRGTSSPRTPTGAIPQTIGRNCGVPGQEDTGVHAIDESSDGHGDGHDGAGEGGQSNVSVLEEYEAMVLH